MPTVYINGKRVRLQPKAAIGKGGEADVYRWTQTSAVKLWKQPNHPDLQQSPQEQAAARQRLKEQQDKLPAFPTNLPSHVITPDDLVLDHQQRIVGYTMRLVPPPVEPLMLYGQRRFRQGMSLEDVIKPLVELARLVYQLHQQGIVIGDFNDLNELVRREHIFLIDADSFQFEHFLCRAYTAKFLDPLLVKGDKLQLDRPHNQQSDWYAFAIMLMQTLLFVGPYGGVYRPKDKVNRCTQDQRPLRRITIFDPEVKYPKFGVPWSALSDDLLVTFQNIFQRDQRGAFPINQLTDARWTYCSTCDLHHARRACPVCSEKAPVSQLVKVVRGNLTITTLLQVTKEQVIHCGTAGPRVEWVTHQDGAFRREDGAAVVRASRAQGQRFRVLGRQTAYSLQPGALQIMPTTPGAVDPETVLVDATAEHTPAFDANSKNVYFCSNSILYRRPWRQAAWYPIGNVFHNRTRFWVGEEYGLGYYRAGEMVVAFCFDANRAGINDQVELPELRSHLVGARAYFAGKLCWLLTAVKGTRGVQHHLSVVDCSTGAVRATESAAEGDGWLGSSIHGKVAVGKSLFGATDEGLIRVDLTRHGAEVTRTFPDTEPYCEESCELLVAPQGGIVVVRPRLIQLLEMGK